MLMQDMGNVCSFLKKILGRGNLNLHGKMTLAVVLSSSMPEKLRSISSRNFRFIFYRTGQPFKMTCLVLGKGQEAIAANIRLGGSHFSLSFVLLKASFKDLKS